MYMSTHREREMTASVGKVAVLPQVCVTRPYAVPRGEGREIIRSKSRDSLGGVR